MDNNPQAVRRTLAVVLLALSFATAACSGALEAAAPPAPTPVVQTVPEGEFTAEFPGAPVYKPETVSAAGHDLVMHTYEVEAANQYVVVSYTDYPKESRPASREPPKGRPPP